MITNVRGPVQNLAEEVGKDTWSTAMLFQNAGCGLSNGFAQTAAYSGDRIRESAIELSRCTEEMLATRNPLEIATCYGAYLARLGQLHAERSAEIWTIMVAAWQPEDERAG